MARISTYILYIVLFFLPFSLSAQNFTPGNLSVLQVNGTTSAASPVTVCEYSPTTLNQSSPVNSWPLPSGSGSNNLTLSGSATSDGNMTLDSERMNLIVPGYDAASGTSAVTGASGINRIILAFDPSGNYTVVSNVPQSQAFNGNNFRSATGAGNRYYGAGAGSNPTPLNGIRIMGAATSTQVAATVNTRVVQIFNGQLYYSTNNGTKGIYMAGTGIPVASGTASTLVASANSPFSFALSPDNNTLYVADDGAGILKYTRTGGSGVFTASPVLSSILCRGLTVDFTTSPYIIYATTAPSTGVNAIIRIIDGSSTTDTLALASTGTIFRGLTFSPGSYAKISGGGNNICSGSSETITFYGNPGDTITYSVNGINKGLRLGNNGVNVLNTGTLTAVGRDSVYSYSLVSIAGSLGTTAVSGSATITVSPSIPAPFTGPSNVCQGGTFSLSDITPGGSWSSSDPSIASISASSGSGIGVTANATTISYSLTNVCGLIIRTSTMTVNPLPSGGTIVGPTSVCAGSTISLTNTTSVGAGSWSTTSTLASISSSTGSLTAGATSGNVIITYTATTASCGSTTLTTNITINPLPNPGSITGADSLCAGSTISLSSTGTSGGGWISSNPSVATVNATGIVTAVSAGSVTIRYKVTTPSCGSDSTQKIILVKPLPNAGSIVGPTSVCAGSIISLTNTTSVGAGSWSTTSTLASISSSTGSLTAGATSGNAIITYTATTASCGSTTLTTNITINPLPNSGSITGADSLCVSSTISLTSTGTSGGVWISSNPSVATVNVTGIVSAVSAGSVTIRYKVTTPSCGSDSTQKIILVKPLPNAGSIVGPTSVCAGSTISLTNTTGVGAGSWSTTSTLASISNSTGSLTAGSTSGNAIITYTATTASCGSTTITTNITINPLPNSGSITGADSLCVSSTISLTSTGTSGGVWISSNPSIATVNATGIVGGVMAGSVSIKYKVTTPTCGSDSVNKIVHINPLPVAGTIGGSSFVCSGSAITLTNTTFSGVGRWSSTSLLVSINDTSGRLIAGSISGTATVTFTASTYSCGIASTSTNVHINALPNPGIITGADSLCVGTGITLTSSGDLGGAWTSSNISIATINSFGVLTASAAGSVIIRYIVSTPTCGNDSTAKTIVVNPVSSAGSISGPTSLCAGSTITLGNSGSFGIGSWSSSSSLVTVNPTNGSVTAGSTSGNAIISYTAYTYSCGSSIVNYPIIINQLPYSGTISGIDTLCPGNSATLSTSGMTGGVWSTNNLTIATISATGTVFAVSSGVTMVRYKVTTPSCGSDSSTYSIFVRPLANAGTITGAGSVCVGFSLSLADVIPGGIWSSSVPAIATVSGGVVTGISTGSSIISYSVSNLCNTAVATATVTVTPATITPITGTHTVCVGGITTLFNVTAGGTWVSANSSVASISATGVVTGISQGTTLISYTVLNSCGLITDTESVQVNPLPYAGTIIASNGSVLCKGTSITLTDAIPGGSWSSSNPAVAIVLGTGIVNGLNSGNTIIYYTVSNSCGSAFDTISIAVNAPPVLGAIPQITVQSPSWLCNGTMYQNFGTSSPAPSGAYYSWSVNNAQIYATGAGAQYCLVNFPYTGEATVYLSTYNTGNICPAKDTFRVEVANSPIDHPSVTYSAGVFTCTPDQSTYQWGYDDATTLEPTYLLGETSKNYSNPSPDLVSKYYWVITNHLLCQQKTYYKVPVSVINVNEHLDYAVLISPNPSDGNMSVKISSEITESGIITMTDILGKTIISVPFESNSSILLHSNQPSGLYFITVKSQHINYTSKAVIQ